MVAISVDPVETAETFKRELRLPFTVASDPDVQTIRAWQIENLEVGELAWHAVFIVDAKQRIVYRKMGGTRPESAELLAAWDYHVRGSK